MEVFIERENKAVHVKGVSTGKALLKKLKITPTTVILVRENEVILAEEKLGTGDRIKILSVVSGG